VKRSFTATAPDTTWFADITEHPTQDGILYLASVLDAFDKTIVGWSMGDRATTELVVNAVEMAVSRRNPIIPPIHHSDRGAQPRFKGSLQQLPGLHVSWCCSWCWPLACLPSSLVRRCSRLAMAVAGWVVYGAWLQCSAWQQRSAALVS
jgi:transposase InsO family protein